MLTDPAMIAQFYAGAYASIKFSDTLDKIREALKTAPIAEVSDHIRALNAYVARCIRQHSETTGRSITQLGANKFYPNDAFTPMKDGKGSLGLRAMRGYYTSIRPGPQGPLVNVNVATTAFLDPILVSEMLDNMGQMPDNDTDDESTVKMRRVTRNAAKVLGGARIRIAYIRQEFAETAEQGYSMNDELPRTRIFQQFGRLAGEQRFFKVLEKDPNNPNSKRRIAATDKGTTVLDYFKSRYAQTRCLGVY
jgi:eukaryotic translation initiation factor 2C